MNKYHEGYEDGYQEGFKQGVASLMTYARGERINGWNNALEGLSIGVSTYDGYTTVVVIVHDGSTGVNTVMAKAQMAKDREAVITLAHTMSQSATPLS